MAAAEPLQGNGVPATEGVQGGIDGLATDSQIGSDEPTNGIEEGSGWAAPDAHDHCDTNDASEAVDVDMDANRTQGELQFHAVRHGTHAPDPALSGQASTDGHDRQGGSNIASSSTVFSRRGDYTVGGFPPWPGLLSANFAVISLYLQAEMM